MEHPLPPGIFVEMENWTEEDFDNEIRRLRERVRELEAKKVTCKEDDDDDDDIMHDPDVREMVENGEHTCHMFDAHCQACEDDEEEESEDEDDITIAELMWDIHNDITLADLTKQIIREENRLKKKKEKEQAVSSDEEGSFEFVDEMTYYSRSSEHLPNF